MDEYQVAIDVWEDGQRLHVATPFPFRDKDLIMQLPGARYEQKEHRFFAPLSWASCVSLRGIFGDRLIVGDRLREWSYQEYVTRIEPAIKLREATDADGDADLYGFQRAGVQFMAFAQQALLCDDMGTGKTVQTIRALKELDARGMFPFPAIVIAPNNMVLTWLKEFNRWWPEVLVVAVPGGTPAMKRRELIGRVDAAVLVVSYETARLHSRLMGYGDVRLKRCVVCDPTLADVTANSQSRCEFCRKELNTYWETVIVDEAHKLKNPKSKQTRACWSIRMGSATFKIKPARFAFGLTGTPIGNAPHDLWPALRLIKPDEFPSRSKYVERFCRLAYNPFGPMTITGLTPDPEKRAEFYKIVDPLMRRMPKEAVLPQLPPKTYTERYVTMPPKQRVAYERMEKEMIAHLEGGTAIATNPLVQLTRLSQFASAYAVMEDGEVRLSDPSCKVDAMMEILEELYDQPAVVFAHHRQLIELACAQLDKQKIKYVTITGGQNAYERQQAIDEFQAGRARVILCTISAGGIGITLTLSSVAIFLQRSWSIIDNSQAEDRVHRIGSEQHDKVEIIDIVAMGTLEERQRTVLDMKSERLEEIVRDRDTLARLLGVTS